MKKTALPLAGITPRSRFPVRFSTWLAGCVALPCVLLAGASWSASFDCSKAGSANEKIICNDPELSRLDDKLGKTFKQARKKAASRHAFSVASDQQWRWREQNCHDRTCLVDWYQRRQMELEAALVTPEDTAQADTAKTPEPKMTQPVKPTATAKAVPEPASTPVVIAEAKTPEPKASKPGKPTTLAKTSPETASTPAIVAEAKMPAPKSDKPAKLTAQAKTENTATVAVPPVAATTVAQPATSAVPAKSTLKLQLSSAQIADIAPEGVSARAHYVSASKGEYLYADTEAGGDSRATVSVRYLGTERGQHIIELRRKDVYTRYTCSADCALIGKLQLPGDADTDMVILKNDHKSLPSLIVTDALNGLLLESVVVR